MLYLSLIGIVAGLGICVKEGLGHIHEESFEFSITAIEPQ